MVPLALCKQEEDLGSEEVEEKVKEEEKDEEKEKARKDLARVRKEKERAKAKERKAKESVLEGQFAVYVIKKDTGETNAPIDTQCEMSKQKQVRRQQYTTHRIKNSIQGRMSWSLEAFDRPQVERTQES